MEENPSCYALTSAANDQTYAPARFESPSCTVPLAVQSTGVWFLVRYGRPGKRGGARSPPLLHHPDQRTSQPSQYLCFQLAKPLDAIRAQHGMMQQWRFQIHMKKKLLNRGRHNQRRPRLPVFQRPQNESKLSYPVIVLMEKYNT